MSTSESQPIVHEVTFSPWKLGVFFHDPEDSRVFVPQRFGFGWTLNLGQPISWGIVALLVVLALVSRSKRAQP